MAMFSKGKFLAATMCAFVLCAYSCRKYVFEFQPKSKFVEDKIHLTVDRPSETDVLFVIDSSGSMKQHQDNLQRNISAYIDILSKSPNKFQIAITTTDLNDCNDVPPAGNPWDGKCGRLLSPDGQDPIIRRVDYPCNAPEGEACINPALVDRFRAIVNAVGTNGSGYEQGIKAAARAVDPELTAAGKPNSGLVRPGALLMMVILSDESDCSYSYNQQDGYAQFIGRNLEAGQSCYQFRDILNQEGGGASVKEWSDRVAVVKGRKSLASVCAITAGKYDRSTKTFTAGNCSIDAQNEPTDACSCFFAQPTDFCAFPYPDVETASRQPPVNQSQLCPSTKPGGGTTTCCNGPSCCIAMADNRYKDFADSFPLRFKDSICRGNYSETLTECARISLRDCFPLARGPVDGREDYITVKRKLAGEKEFSNVPQVPASTGFAGDGWFLFTDRATTSGETVNEVCLAGSYKRVIGDTYEIEVFVQAEGLESDIPADTQ